MGHVTRPCSIQRHFVIHGLGLAMIKLHSKFEVSIFTHYKNINATKNVEIRVVWGLGFTQGNWQYHHSIDSIWLSIWV